MYVGTGQFFARVKVRGKPIRRKLGTDVFTTAKLRLGDFIKKEQARRPSLDSINTFGDAHALYESDIEVDHGISAHTKRYRKFCLKKLDASWPSLKKTRLNRITETDCRAWAGRLALEIDAQYFNNVLGTFRAVLKRAGVAQSDDPSRDVKRMSVVVRELHLPSLAQFNMVLHEMETSGTRQSPHCADFARGLAYSGCRLSEARRLRPCDIFLDTGKMRIQGAKIRRAGKVVELTRTVDMIQPMRDLAVKLVSGAKEKDCPLFGVGECEKSLARACRIVGIPVLTHHKLRDLFATICIESGVDIPTVAEWLGHRDGGALLLKRYRKHREEHSASMAERVTFNPSAP